MYCIKCGTEIQDNSFKFCPICGYKVVIEESNNLRDIVNEPEELIDNNNSEETTLIKHTKNSTYNRLNENIVNLNQTLKNNTKKIAIIMGSAIALAIVVLLLVKIINKTNEIDITHGGEERYIASSDFEWRFDYNWAEYDEKWDKISSTSEIDVLADLLLQDGNLGNSIDAEVAKNYIESRLNPVGYVKDTYWEFCPEKKAKYAEEMWQKYLKDHKELRRMYIVIREKKYYPYADDDFDKNVFMNPYTSTKVLSSSGAAKTGADYEIPLEGMGVIEYNPFDFVTISFSGLSKRAKAELKYTGSYLTEDDFEISQSDHLSNGDEIIVSVINPDVEANYGCELLQTEKTYEVESLDECVEPENMTAEELAYLEATILAKIADADDRLGNVDKMTKQTFAASIVFTEPYSDHEPLNKFLFIYQEDFRSREVLPHRYFYIVEVDEFVRKAGSGEYQINDIHLRGSSFLPQSNGEISAVESTDVMWNKYILPEFDKYENQVSNYAMSLFNGVPIKSIDEINNAGRETIYNFTKDYVQRYIEKLRSNHKKWTITDSELFETRLYRMGDKTSTVVMIMKFFVNNNSSSAASSWETDVYMPIIFENVALDENAGTMYSRCAGEDYAIGVPHGFPRSSGNVRGYTTLEDMEKGLAKTFPLETKIDSSMDFYENHQGEGTQYIVIKNDFVCVRDSASTSGNLIAKVSKGEKFPLYEESDGWYRFNYYSAVGYVRADMAECMSESAAPGELNDEGNTIELDGIRKRVAKEFESDFGHYSLYVNNDFTIMYEWHMAGSYEGGTYYKITDDGFIKVTEWLYDSLYNTYTIDDKNATKDDVDKLNAGMNTTLFVYASES